jgi:FkbM family methyltransferase
MASFDFVQIGAHVGTTKNDRLCKACGRLKKRSRGILVEPVPYLFKRLVRNYAKYTNFIFLNEAVSSKLGKLKLYVPSEGNDFGKYEYWADQIASASPDHIPAHVSQFGLESMKTEKMEVECTTINEIIDRYCISRLGCLVVDTEGHDYQILKILDFSKVKPQVVMFENKHMDGPFRRRGKYRKLLAYFKSNGYRIRTEGVENTIMTRK